MAVGPDNPRPVEIVIDALEPATMELWRTVAKLARAIPGGGQALHRIETVIVVIDGERIKLHRPTLIGAILLKARSVRVHSRPEDQRQDVIQLLGLMTDPRTVLDTLTKTERRWLRAIDDHLALDDRQLDATIDTATLRVARAAYRRLTA